MKKNFAKKLASVLSLAMVVTMVPAAPASAATAPNLAKRYTNVYEGKSYSYTVKDAKGYSVKWVVDGNGAEYADLSKTTGSKTTLTLDTNGETAAKNSNVVVRARFYKNNKLVKTAGDAVKVKVSATAVDAVTAADVDAIVVNEVADFNRSITPANATSTTYWSVTDKDGKETTDATIDKTGNFKATKLGEYVVVAEAKNAKKGVTIAKDTQAVKVVNKITNAKATTPTKLALTFAAPLTSVAKDNFVVVTADTNSKAYVKTATLSADKTVVTLEFYNELTSGKTYNVTANLGTEKYTASADYVKGAVASITGTNQIVKAVVNPTDEAQKVVYTVLDENGLDVTDTTPVRFESNVAINDGKISLGNGVLVYVTVIYTNPTTGAEIKSNTFTVTGSSSTATQATGFTIADSTPSKWPTAPTTSIALKDNSKFVFVQTTDQYGKTSVNNNVTFESLDPSVFVVDAATGKITTVAVGSGQFKATFGKVSQIFTITVTPEAKASKLALDASTVTKASLTNVGTNKANINVNVLDQNGKELNGDASSSALTVQLLSGNNVVSYTNGGAGVETTTAAQPLVAGSDLALYAKTAGTAIFKISSNNNLLSYITVAVTVYAEDNVITSYGIDGVKDLDINNAYDNDNTTDFSTTFNVAAKNAGGFTVNTVSGASIKMVAPNGTETTVTGADVTTNCTTVGTYKLYATSRTATIATASFTVKDSGSQPNVFFTKNTITKANIASSLADIINLDGAIFAGIKFTSGNTAAVPTPSEFATTYTVGGTGNVYLYNVVIKVTKNGRPYEINTNTTLTVTNN